MKNLTSICIVAALVIAFSAGSAFAGHGHKRGFAKRCPAPCEEVLVTPTPCAPCAEVVVAPEPCEPAPCVAVDVCCDAEPRCCWRDRLAARRAAVKCAIAQRRAARAAKRCCNVPPPCCPVVDVTPCEPCAPAAQ